MFLEFRYAVTGTDTWSTNYPPVSGSDGKIGPEIKWDSSRSRSPESLGTALFNELWKPFRFHCPSLGYDEKVFPTRVLIIIGLVPDDDPFAYLQGNISATDDEITLDGTDGMTGNTDEEYCDIHQLIYIDGEWITYNGIDSKTLHVQSRGARFTEPAKHYDGAAVYCPRIYSMEVLLPGGFVPR